MIIITHVSIKYQAELTNFLEGFIPDTFCNFSILDVVIGVEELRVTLRVQEGHTETFCVLSIASMSSRESSRTFSLSSV